MQAYGAGFARTYNRRWRAYVERVAPLIQGFYESDSDGAPDKRMLDLCCGTGQLAVHFLDKGYRVVGLDLSEHMLGFAAENAATYVRSGQARFVKADAADFKLDERFGLVVSTYDSLNHLEDMEALTSCFRCVRAICDGLFIFDLNTRRGLEVWNSVSVQEGVDEDVIIKRGVFDRGGDRAWLKITGFTADDGGLYRRFDEVVYNTAHDMARVKQALFDVGWEQVNFARMNDLTKPIEEPELEGRVFVLAK